MAAKSAQPKPAENKIAVKFGPLVLAVGVVLILTLIVIPLPTFMLDVLLAMSIAASLCMLMVTLYTEKQVDLSGFPTILLLLTLLRLGLNISSTRLILSQGYAGKVIDSFGNFVISGNYIVGAVVFGIITVIQFMVITKGSTRVAEVAARFTLDAMPGKQMAIDADLNAGLIDELEAVRRRDEIQARADFYGSMDGASKFVRGDATAGLVITAINVIGGLVIGMVQLKMGIFDALKTYTLLSIGDGLVSQVPALITSTTAGLIVAKSSSGSLIGTEISSQILKRPKAFLIAAGVLMMFGIVPGLPFFPFAFMASICGGIYFAASQQAKKAQQQAQAEEKAQEESQKAGGPQALPSSREMLEQVMKIDPMEIEIGFSLIPLIDREQGGDILDRITQIRKQCATENGLVVPPIRIRDNMELPGNVYHIKVKGIKVAEGEIRPRQYMAMKPGGDYQDLEGIRALEPAFGLPALWIADKTRTKAEAFGYTVVEPSSVLATHITETINRHADQLLSRQDTQEILDTFREEMPAVVNDLVPNMLNIGHLHRVLQNLLKERVPIKDMATILETLYDYAQMTKDIDVLTEYVRRSLAGHITKQYEDQTGKMSVITLDPAIEQMIIDFIQKSEKGMGGGLDPSIIQTITQNAAKLLDQPVFMTNPPVLLCSPAIRRYMKNTLERYLPHLAVLSFNEVLSSTKVESHGAVSLTMETQEV